MDTINKRNKKDQSANISGVPINQSQHLWINLHRQRDCYFNISKKK